ncbi:2-haloacid dehalogenase [Thermosporothrix hazakensis]|jgi:2-haloacid dehalogenase|uniref:2-haloacid dehalogenase n=1 Tax=Thermosporothrix hazakensis TaxID=644383 RepID=A0A326U4M4_THEHA|nr:haloacid dehalogenase type II [Thermosporothrix hazakensis]PZW27982.1 2-haloacid dehalogenase [Thermosporothrix hazakensis]GCE51205.1 haloacid dehalogenase [Thermosporothrix hazakensis]
MQKEQYWATFDCYGTLVDWDTGMYQAIASIAPEQVEQLFPLCHALQNEIEAEQPFRTYRQVLAESLLRASTQLGITLPPGGEHVLADTLPRWPIFADVGPALQALRDNGWKLVILSNVDNDLIAQTLQAFPVSIDAVITAEEVRAYKPALNHFNIFQQRFQVDKEHWVHIARSAFHDIAPAHTLGLRSIWVNRAHEPAPPLPPTKEIPDLTGLLAAVQEVIA